MNDGSSGLPAGDRDLLNDIVTTSRITKNLEQEVHVTTRDKVELALRRQLPAYTSTEQLAASLGVFLAFSVALMTSDFKRALGINPDSWQGIFGVAALASLVWLAFEFNKWRKRPRLKDVVDEVLRSSDRIDT